MDTAEDSARRIAQLESALAEQRQRFDLALSAVDHAWWEWNIAADLVTRSAAWTHQLGADQAPPDCALATFALNCHIDDRAATVNRLRKAVDGGEAAVDLNYRLHHRDGGWRWFRSRARILRDTDGQALRVIGLQADISAEREREAALADTLGHYRALYDNAPLAFVAWDREGRIIDWNRSAENLFGHVRHEALGRRLVSLLFPPSAQDGFVDIARRLLKRGGAHGQEFDNLAADASALRCSWQSVALKNQRGTVVGVLSLVQDITAQWQAAAARQRDELRNRALIETSPDAIFMLDVEGRIVNVNQQGVHLLRADDSSDLVGTHSALWIEDKEVDDFLARVIAEPGDRVGFVARSEMFFVGMNATEVLADLSYTTLGDAAGEPVGIVLFARDITEKRRIEKELEQYRDHLEGLVAERTARLAEIIESSPIPTFVIGPDHLITHWNRACEQVVGGTATEMIGTRNAWLLFYPEPRPVMADLVLSGELERVDALYAGKHRRSRDVVGAFEAEDYFPTIGRWLYFNAAPLHDLQGKVVGAIETLQDITARKEAQIALEQAKELAENAARTKADFLANMSHEIRTPMNAVIGLAHLTLRTQLTPRQRDYVERIKGSGGLLLGLLNDVLDLSKIEAGQMSMECEPFVLDDVLDSVATLVAGRAREKALEFHFLVAPEVPQDLIGDALRLTQVLVNLCGNAIKFTERGHVVARIDLASRDADTVRLAVAVEDSGIGLTPEQSGRLFQAFSQADTSTTRKFGGTGLGLIISKRIVEMMNGAIGLESEAGVGTRFHFDVALGAGPAQAMHAARVPVALQGISALVIDDHPLAREALCGALHQLGMAASACAAVPAAIDAVSAGLVLLDAELPGALEAARALKNRAAPPRVVLLVTGDAELTEIQTAASGVDDVAAKPLTLSRLLRLFAALCGETPAVAGGGRAPAHFAGQRVLLAEDIATNRMIAIEMLSEWGLAVDVAENGAQAVEQLLAETEAKYALVLMDIQMPELDGIEATRRIRAAGRRLPVIAMTAHSMTEERERCVAAGMDDFATKPIDPDLLLAVLMRHIPVPAGAAISAPASTAVPPAPTATSTALALPGIDTRAGLERMMDRPAFYERVLRSFHERFAGIDREIATALAADRREDALRLAHSLKGLGATIGAITLSTTAAALEESIRAGGDSQAGLDALGRELATVIDGLAAAYGL